MTDKPLTPEEAAVLRAMGVGCLRLSRIMALTGMPMHVAQRVVHSLTDRGYLRALPPLEGIVENTPTWTVASEGIRAIRTLKDGTW